MWGEPKRLWRCSTSLLDLRRLMASMIRLGGKAAEKQQVRLAAEISHNQEWDMQRRLAITRGGEQGGKEGGNQAGISSSKVDSPFNSRPKQRRR
jgi:hypothetical protein